MQVYGDWGVPLYHKLVHDYWAVFVSIPVEKHLNKGKIDILRFLAENGIVSEYDLRKGILLPKTRRPGMKRIGQKSGPRRGKGLELEYDRMDIRRNVETLEKSKLIKIEKTSRGKLKKYLELTFDGLLAYLKAWKEVNEEAKESMQKAIINYQSLLPFSSCWRDIEQAVGSDRVFTSLVQTARDIGGRFIEFNIKGLKFKGFVNSNVLFEDYLNLTHQEKKKSDRDEKFTEFLAVHDELKNTYLSYLVLQDIVRFVTRGLPKRDWEYQKELAFLREKDLNFNQLPKFAGVTYVFTGMFIEKLLWKESAAKETPYLERNGFTISLSP